MRFLREYYYHMAKPPTRLLKACRFEMVSNAESVIDFFRSVNKINIVGKPDETTARRCRSPIVIRNVVFDAEEFPLLPIKRSTRKPHEQEQYSVLACAVAPGRRRRSKWFLSNFYFFPVCEVSLLC